MSLPSWIDTLLWANIRAYRRRKMRQSRVYAELLQPVPRDIRLLDAYLERPAILAGKHASDRPEGARMSAVIGPYQMAMLREKLEDEAIMRGNEGWCEYCGTTGTCSICGANHDLGGA